MTMKKGMIVTSALIIWKALMCITGSESPVVVVLSGSMEPGFKRGDILFLHMSKDPIRAGEIVVFNVDGHEIPIVHHVIKVHEWQHTGEVDVLTKGARFWKIELFDWNLLRCNLRLLFLEVDIIIHGRWIQAVFCHSDDASSSSSMEASVKIDLPGEENIEPKVRENTLTEVVNKFDVDMSEGVAVDMFGISPSNDNETVVVNLGESKYKIEVLSTEYQHTCKSTGLMLWESARLMASVLAANPTIVAGKWVLELGCGCGGICSMAAAVSAVHSFLLVREYADYQSRIVVKSEVIFEV